MDDSRTTRGYALTGLMCIGGLACGPGGGAEAQDSGESTGYPMTGTGESESGSSTGAETETETGELTVPETDGPSDCSYRGDICGEMSVCQCSCDYSADCCSCEATSCTQNIHCEEGKICLVYVDQHWTQSACVPPGCANASDIWMSGPAADPSAFADVVCAFRMQVTETSLVDLTAFANLDYVLEGVNINNNPALATLGGLAISEARTIEIAFNDNLTSIDALTSLTSIEGGMIYCNPQLPAADVAAVLAQIPGGNLVEVAQNGEGPC